MNALHNWNLDDKVRRIVEKTVFKSFLYINYEARHFLPIITTIAKTFDDKRFCFNSGAEDNRSSIIVNLEEVLYTTGLPIDGNPVSGSENISDAIYERMLGRIPSGRALIGRKINVTQLKENF